MTAGGARRRACGWLAAVALLMAGCAGDDAAPSAPGGPTDDGNVSAVVPGPDDDSDAGDGDEDPATATLDATPSDCPAPLDTTDGLGAGLHEGLASGGQERAFHLLLPEENATDGPRPLFVALTGTVQSEEAFLAQSGLDALPDEGWIVVAPVRNNNGLLWGPWDAMRTPEQADLPNPDLELLDDVVACVAAHHAVDANRIFIGGISIGGTMVNYVLQRRSELYAGGIVGSGNFITTSPLDPEPLEDMVVIVAWGGESDEWSGCMDGRMGREAGESGDPGCIPGISFVTDAALASQFFDAEANVAQVACSMEVGHRWITEATPWFATLLATHPKGSGTVVDLPPDVPDGLECTTGAFVVDDAD
ncbi:MAG: prolyl oligopeptidase family serine peptidase [Acidimicrobiia bacterium]|nr:prolyl oligopeptidase family serine peptidase [Acidimicrobiia bacterium]